MTTVKVQPKKTFLSNGEGDKDYYVHPETGARLIRVTRITSVPTNYALENWKIAQNRAQLLDAAVQVFADGPDGMTPEELRERIIAVTKDIRRDQLKADAAADVGSIMHKYISDTLRYEMGLIPDPPAALPDNLRAGFAQWDEWRKSVNLTPDYVESVVYDTRLGYAGTMDFSGVCGGQTTIADWKTSGGLYPGYRMQVAAYRNAFHEMDQGVVNQTLLVLVPVPKEKRTPKFTVEIMDAQETERHFVAFRACLHIFRWLEYANGNGAR